MGRFALVLHEVHMPALYSIVLQLANGTRRELLSPCTNSQIERWFDAHWFDGYDEIGREEGEIHEIIIVECND